MVNDYLCFQSDDVCYHASKTKGQAGHRIVRIYDGHWGFVGELLRENQPYTDSANFYYYGRKMWEMKRHIILSPSYSDQLGGVTMDRVLVCALEAAKNYDRKMPWRGPRFYTDTSTGYHYEAEYYDSEDGKAFSIRESIRDPYGKLLWTAVCEGGYA